MGRAAWAVRAPLPKGTWVRMSREEWGRVVEADCSETDGIRVWSYWVERGDDRPLESFVPTDLGFFVPIRISYLALNCIIELFDQLIMHISRS